MKAEEEEKTSGHFLTGDSASVQPTRNVTIETFVRVCACVCLHYTFGSSESFIIRMDTISDTFVT